MQLNDFVTGKFIRRVNRFIAEVALSDGNIVPCHLANTGRMSELLIEGRPCLLRPAKNPARKTAWDLVMVEYHNQWVCLVAVFANQIFERWLEEKNIPYFDHCHFIKREKKIGNSRFDFYLEQDDEKWLIEIKSVNFVVNGHAKFPDAPTSRGKRHVEELLKLKEQGYHVGVVFITMGQHVRHLSFNWDSDPAFASIMAEAAQADIYMKAFSATFEPPNVIFSGERPIHY